MTISSKDDCDMLDNHIDKPFYGGGKTKNVCQFCDEVFCKAYVRTNNLTRAKITHYQQCINVQNFIKKIPGEEEIELLKSDSRFDQALVRTCGFCGTGTG